jgi:tetratricopeptide (TPR) repeat protein
LREELCGLIEEVQKFRGRDARQHEAFFHGRLGDVCFHSGRMDEAAPCMQRALEICRAINDEQGVAAYLGNLAEIARYRGDTAGAIALFEQLQAQWLRLGQSDAAATAGRQLARLRAGEPLLRIVCRDGERTIELDELHPATGTHYHFEFVRNRLQLQKAITLTRLASEKAAAGELAAAIELFQAASEVDPHDPDPHYQCGIALMDLGAFAAARESFAEVERLAPGWFHCRTDHWIAGQVESGELPVEAWTILHGLEDAGLPKSEVESLARQALDRFPQFAPLWLVLGDCLRDRQSTAEAERAYRRGIDAAQEPNVESRLLVALAGILPAGSDERRQLVLRALELKGSLVAQAVACILKIR